MSKFFEPRILDYGHFSEDVPYDLHPGDSILYPEQGLAYALLTLLLEDKTYETWDALVVAHADPGRLGKTEMLSFGTRQPLGMGAVIVRNA